MANLQRLFRSKSAKRVVSAMRAARMLRIRKQLAAPVIQAAYRAWMARRMSANLRVARFLLLRLVYVPPSVGAHIVLRPLAGRSQSLQDEGSHVSLVTCALVPHVSFP